MRCFIFKYLSSAWPIPYKIYMGQSEFIHISTSSISFESQIMFRKCCMHISFFCAYARFINEAPGHIWQVRSFFTWRRMHIICNRFQVDSKRQLTTCHRYTFLDLGGPVQICLRIFDESGEKMCDYLLRGSFIFIYCCCLFCSLFLLLSHPLNMNFRMYNL